HAATVATSTSGYSVRRMAAAHVPSAPAPYTTARPLNGGGLRVIACNATANGSASTATSSGTPSGTGIIMCWCAGTSSAKPPVASDELPVWMPGASRPSWKWKHMLQSPTAHDGHIGVMPRGPHDNQG